MRHNFNLPKAYLSASAINSYQVCGIKYKKRYIDNKKGASNAALITGSAGHNTLETYYYDKIAGNQLLTAPQVQEYSVAALEIEADKNDFTLTGPAKDTAVIELHNILGNYIDLVAPYVTPIAVEEEVTYTTECGVDLLGYIDLIRDDFAIQRPKQSVCVDYKFTASKWSHSKLIDSLQLMIYSVVTDTPTIEIQNFLKSKSPPAANFFHLDERFAPQQDVASNIRFLRHTFDIPKLTTYVNAVVKSVATGISKGVFTHCDPSHWLCSEKWCEYYAECRG